MPRLSFSIEFGPGQRLGPGKIELLEQIGATGSISAAGRELHMSYPRAWMLVAVTGCCEWRCEFLTTRGPEGPSNHYADAQNSA
jgi:hypothetical protein